MTHRETTKRPPEEWTNQELDDYIKTDGKIIPKKNELERLIEAFAMIGSTRISWERRERI